MSEPDDAPRDAVDAQVRKLTQSLPERPDEDEDELEDDGLFDPYEDEDESDYDDE